MQDHSPNPDTNSNADGPRERMVDYGAQALTDAELIALLLGTGSQQESVMDLAQRMLNYLGGLNGLATATPRQLNRIHGLGKAKTSRLMAAIEIHHRLNRDTATTSRQIKTSSEAAQLILDMGHYPQEHIRVILLDGSRHVIDIPIIYIGTVNTAVTRISEILRPAITHNAPAFILVHNHPSGDTQPSPEDVYLTQQLRKAATLLDIQLLDHIIVGNQQWSSLRDMGL